ncbi:MAG: hypothetical protein ABI723_22615 [Bacteroidia bacterium]
MNKYKSYASISSLQGLASHETLRQQSWGDYVGAGVRFKMKVIE